MALAHRAALLCGNPTCRKLTQGPSRDRVDKRTNAGCAAHICGAARRGPRYDKTQSAAERKSAANGIWLCRNCGEIVDDDETTYPATLLRVWKAMAEAFAERNLGAPPSAWEGAPARPMPRVTWADGLTVLTMRPARVASALDEVEVNDRRFDEEAIAALSEADATKARHYNDALDEWQAQTNAARARARVCDLFDQGVLAKIVLHNDGRAPLVEPRCILRFPAELVVADEAARPERLPFPALPRRPSIGPPRPPQPFDFFSQTWGATFAVPAALTFPSLSIPRVSDGLYRDDDTFRAHMRSLTHNMRYAFEDGVRVAAPLTPGVLRVDVAVHAHNMPEAWEGELTIEIRPEQELEQQEDGPAAYRKPSQ